MTDDDVRRAAARDELKIASEGDTADMQAMILSTILLGRTEGSCDHVAAYNLAVLAVVLFTRDGEPDVAAGYAAAGRWMIRHRWYKASEAVVL